MWLPSLPPNKDSQCDEYPFPLCKPRYVLSSYLDDAEETRTITHMLTSICHNDKADTHNKISILTHLLTFMCHICSVIPHLTSQLTLSRLNRLFLFLPSLGIESCGDEDGTNTFRSAGAAVSGLTFPFPPSFLDSAWIICPSLDLLLHAPVNMADVKFLIASHVYTPACPHTVCPRHIRGAVTSSPRSNFSRPYAVARAGAQAIVGTNSCGPYLFSCFSPLETKL